MADEEKDEEGDAEDNEEEGGSVVDSEQKKRAGKGENDHKVDEAGQGVQK